MRKVFLSSSSSRSSSSSSKIGKNKRRRGRDTKPTTTTTTLSSSRQRTTKGGRLLLLLLELLASSQKVTRENNESRFVGCFLRSQKHVLPNTYYCNSLSRRLHKHKKKDHRAKTRETTKERSIIRRWLFWCWCCCWCSFLAPDCSPAFR